MKNLTCYGRESLAPEKDLFGSLFDEFLGGSFWPARRWSPASSGVEIIDKEDDYLVRAALPGFEKKDLEVSVQGNTLTLAGQRGGERFGNSFSLPAIVNSSKLTAEYRNGILEIRLPKNEEAKARQIEIK